MTSTPDDSELRALDPADLLDQEAARLSTYFRSLPESEWSRSSRCPGWTIRDVLAHLASSEDYHHACLDGEVKAFLSSLETKGATDLTTANALGIDEQAGLTAQELIERSETANARTRQGFRQRAGGRVDTSVGDYPSRWQAFHVASELATHADDVYVPVENRERDARLAWRAAISRFALAESKPDLEVNAVPGGTRVTGHGVEATVADDVFVEAVAGRLDEGAPLARDVRAVLNATP